MFSSVPVMIPAVGWKEIAVGGVHNCGIASDGEFLCWGDNATFECGDATNEAGETFVSSPSVAFPGGAYAPLHVAAAGSNGDGTTCYLDDAGAAACFGNNNLDQLGGCQPGQDSATLLSSKLPVSVCAAIPGQPKGPDGTYPTYSLAGATRIYTGQTYGCVVVPQSGIYCWGGDYFGQLGDDSPSFDKTAVLSNILLEGVAPANTKDEPLYLGPVGVNTCHSNSFGAFGCIGQDSSDEMGDGTTTQFVSKIHWPTGLGYVSGAAIGASTLCAVHGGGLFCWGDNSHGQVGIGTVTTAPVPTPTLVTW
jgi:hypothetical protein